MDKLSDSIDKLHTTAAGALRINSNLGLMDVDPVEYCRSIILDRNAVIYKQGKNWYVRASGYIITINASSNTIITAHTDKQIERISRFEAILDEARSLLVSEQINEKLPGLIRTLDMYYQSPQWKRDYADDEAGLLPRNLKRGVLSEDGIYDVVETFHELQERCGKTE